MAFGACICCGKTFGFNPVSVPSTAAITGKKEPVCEDCMGVINEKRKAKGLEPFPILPDAYGACEEGALS